MNDYRILVLSHRLAKTSDDAGSGSGGDPEDIICLTDELDYVLMDERDRILRDEETDIV